MLLLEQFEHLTLYPKNAARLKELVLQLAVQGKLTENWRRQNPDVEPAAELLKSIETEKAQLVKEKKIKDYNLSPIAADEVSCRLPYTWSWVKIGEVLDLINGKAFKPTEWAESGLPIIRIQNLNNLNADFNYFDKEVDAKYYVNDGDLLIGWSGTPGTSFGAFIWTRGEAILNQHIFNAKQYINTFDTKYLKISINSILDEMISKAHGGAGLKHITKGKFQNIALAIPPLAEQEAIVARVEELMQKIEELEKQTTERIQLKQHLGTAALQQLTAATDEELEQNWLFLKQHFQTIFDEAANGKKLRETILQLAVQGKLTANWRKQNPITEPASKLLKRIQAEKVQLVKEKKIKKEKPLDPIAEDEVPYTLPEGWVWCRFQDIATVASNLVQPSNYLELPHIAPDNIEKHTGRLLAYKTVKEDNLVSAKHLFYSGQILYSKIRPRLNKVVEINFRGLCSADMYPVDSYIVRGYLFRYMLSNDFVLQSTATEGRVAMPKINQVELNKILVPLPPLAEQEALVAQVDQLMQLCDKLEQQIQQSKQETEALMQAVVQEALQVQEKVVA